MNAIHRKFLFLVAGAFFVSGCDAAPPTQAFEDGEASLAVHAEEGHGPVVQSARGAGHHLTEDDDIRRKSLVALRYEDGTANGQFEIADHDRELRVHGRVTCLTVIGNEAWVGGVVTQSTQPEDSPYDLTGLQIGLRIEDNGEAREDPEDRISDLVIGVKGLPIPPERFAEHICEDTPTLISTSPIDAGNLVVEDVPPAGAQGR